MSEAITFLLGIGITAGIFAIILYNLREEHGLIRFFLLMLLLTLGFFVSKPLWDARTDCETVVANSTQVSNVTTAYEYSTYCYTTTTNTPGTFYTIMLWSYYAIIGYVLIWIFISIIERIRALRFK